MKEKNMKEKNMKLKTLIPIITIFIIIPLTMFAGIVFLHDKKYLLISVCIILETLILFFVRFENKKPQAKDVIIIATLCGIAVASRVAFFAIPNVKPMAAIVIISGIALGAEDGFIIGAMGAFISNFIFGQGPWTVWQMFAFGIVGFLAGVFFNKKGLLGKTKIGKNPIIIAVFGFLSIMVIYGGIINVSSILMYFAPHNLSMFIASYALSIPYDLIHAVSTMAFLLVLSKPMLVMLDRIKIKYGIN